MPFLLLGIGAFALTAGAVIVWLRRAAREQRILERLLAGAAPEAVSVEIPSLPSGPSTKTSAFVRRAVRRAGLSLSAADATLLCLTAGLAAGYTASEAGLALAWTGPIAALAGYAPLAVIRMMGDRRMRKLEAQLADAIDLMVAGLQAGSGVRECLDLIRSQKKAPISKEFHELYSLIEVGIPGATAFKQWSAALDSRIITVFALGMAAKWDIGGNYSVMLGGLAGRIRELIRLQRRVRTLTAEAMLTAVLGLTLPYGLVALQLYFDPHHLDILWESPIGPRALGFAIFLQLVAVSLIRRMIRSIFKGA